MSKSVGTSPWVVLLAMAACVAEGTPDSDDAGDDASSDATFEPTSNDPCLDGTGGCGPTTDEPSTGDLTTGNPCEDGTGGCEPTTGEPTTGEPTSGGELPPQCDFPDDELVAATFELVPEGWPEDDDDIHMIDTDCVVDAIAFENEDSLTVTSLSCDEAGTPLPATLRTSKTPGNALAWAQGDVVRLRAEHDLQKMDYPAPKIIELRSSDDGLLFAGQADIQGADADAFAPLAVAIDSPCGEEVNDVDAPLLPLRLQFTGPAGEALALFHEESDVLVIDGGDTFEIAVAEATTNRCCHDRREIVVYAQRVP